MKKENEENVENEIPKEEESELQICQREREEYLEGWKRARADYANAQKISAQTQKEFVQYAEEKVLYKLLELADTFDEALRQKEDAGITMLRMKLLGILKEHHVEMKEVSPGDKFDPHTHEAISGEGENIQVVAGQAYWIHEKLLRPARVIVTTEKVKETKEIK